jgi:hypothetical protein
LAKLFYLLAVVATKFKNEIVTGDYTPLPPPFPWIPFLNLKGFDSLTFLLSVC